MPKLSKSKLSILGIAVALMSAGPCRRGSSSPKPQPPAWNPQNVGARYFFDDVSFHGTDPICTSLTVHNLPPALDGVASAINADGNLGEYRDSSTMSPREWLDRHLVPGGADNQGADKAQLVGYKGHGYVPDQGLAPNTLQQLAFPLHFVDELDQPHCGPIFSEGNPANGFQATAGLGREYSGNSYFFASHGLFFSSCTAQPRLMIGFPFMQSLTQVFGFAYSPAHGSDDTVSKRLAAFYANTGVLGNARAWTEAFDDHPNEDGTLPAGATVTTYALPNEPLKEYHAASRSPPDGTHMLRLGRFVNRRLPSYETFVRAKMTMNSPCRADPVCGIPTIDETGTTTCPLVNASEMPLEGSPTRVLTSSLNKAPVGTKAPSFGVARTSRTPEQVADIAAAVATRMTDKTFLRKDTIRAATLALSKPRYHYTEADTGEGIALWYDSSRDRMRVTDFIVEDTFDEDGREKVVSPTRAAEIVKEWIEILDQSGMAKSGFWSVANPVVGEIAEIDMELNLGSLPHSRSTLWAYTYSITRTVNGVPFGEQAAKIWIHRSGQVILVDLSGVEPKTSGMPGFEYSEDGKVVTILPLKPLARDRRS
jgi:hypothetical protein